MKKAPLIALSLAAVLVMLGIVAFGLMPGATPEQGTTQTVCADTPRTESVASAALADAAENDVAHRNAENPKLAPVTGADQPGIAPTSAGMRTRRLTDDAPTLSPSFSVATAHSTGGTSATEHTLQVAAERAAAEGRTLGIGNNEIPPGVIPKLGLPAALSDAAKKDLIPEDRLPQLEQLQKEFVAAIGDANDPEYAERWMKARRASDERFRLLFGKEAFLQAERRSNLLGDAANGSK